MAFRVSDLVVDGEIDNTRKGRVTGWVQFSKRPDRVVLELTGDCHPDLAGWKFRIKRLRPAPDWAEPSDATVLNAKQVGEAGDITDAQRLKDSDCSPQELIARIRLDEPPPFKWRNALYLEWFSQANGRVVIQDTRLGVELIGERGFELTDADLKRKEQEAQRRLRELEDEGWVFEETEMGTMIYREDEDQDGDGGAGRSLQRELDRQTLDLDHAVRQSLRESDEETDDGDDPIHDMELLDAYIDDPSRGCRIRDLFDPPLTPPASSEIPDSRIDVELDKLVGRLLSKNVRVDICEHYTSRMAYDWILGVVLDESTMAELPDTDIFVNHMTYEDCQECQKEWEEEWDGLEEQGSCDGDGPELPF